MVAAPPETTDKIMQHWWMPGKMGLGATEQQAVVDALGQGSLSSLRWTLVRAVNARGKASLRRLGRLEALEISVPGRLHRSPLDARGSSRSICPSSPLVSAMQSKQCRSFKSGTLSVK